MKPVIVPAANMMSNMFQLLNRGVPVKAIIHGVGAKTAEISKYVKRRAREVELEAKLRAAEAENDTGTALKLSNRIQAMRDSYKRMSIWPLIEAGEFSAISQGQVTAEDLAMANGSDGLGRGQGLQGETVTPTCLILHPALAPSRWRRSCRNARHRRQRLR